MSLSLKESCVKLPRALFRIFYIITINVICIPTYVVWMILILPLKRIQPHVYYRIEGLFFHWLLAVVSSWLWSAGYDIVEMGDDITKCINHRTLVIANHQSTADVPLLMTAFNSKKDILPNIMWIMDRLFKYTNFGIVSLIHQDFFIASGKSNRDNSLVLLKNHIFESYIPRERKWMVLFPEGGFLRKRRETSQRYAQKNNLPILKNVTLPRVGAMKAICDILAPKTTISTFRNISNNNSNQNAMINGNIDNSKKDYIDKREVKSQNYEKEFSTCQQPLLKQTNDNKFEYILDITIAYQNGVPLDLPNIIHGMRDPCHTYFLYRIYPSTDLPLQTESLTKWLYDRFVEKEKILEIFYKTGNFEHHTANTPTLVQQDFLRYVIIHIFFIASAYIHIEIFSTLLNCYKMYFSRLT